MKKGDDRRKLIMETAERLFYAQGYEATSVQNILDQLQLSKGGFYHHFESKLQLLEAICEQRCEASHRAAEEAVKSCTGNAVDKLNAMFHKSGIWQNDSMDFIGLLIRVTYRDGSVLLREKMKQISYAQSLPLFNSIVEQGIREGVFFTPYPEGIGELILLLGSNLTDEIATILSKPQEQPEDLLAILDKLELYRHAVETLLGAPYGSVVIYEMERMVEVCRAIQEQNRRLSWEYTAKSLESAPK